MASSHLRHRYPIHLRAFTLIELLVVTAIIALITGAVLINNNHFGGVIQLENLAYDVALSVRQAQVYGISVQRTGAGSFSTGYGMHFNVDDPNHYELFTSDVTGTGLFDPANNVPPSPYTIRGGYKIQSICVAAGRGGEDCTAKKADIFFKRPEPDAWISVSLDASDPPSCIQNTNVCQGSARVILASPRGDTMSVLIEANGQISVQK